MSQNGNRYDGDHDDDGVGDDDPVDHVEVFVGGLDDDLVDDVDIADDDSDEDCVGDGDE